MVLIVAHRGDPRKFRENTLPGLASAISGGANWVEADVRLTGDKVPVLLHDETLLRCWGIEQRLESISFADLGAALGDSDWQVPTLADAIEMCRDSKVPLMIDIPGKPEGRSTHALVSQTKAESAVVLAGDPEALAEIRSDNPGMRIAMSWSHSPFPPRRLLQAVRPQVLNELHTWLSEPAVAQAHKLGMQVCSYVVDEADDIRRQVRIGVDAVTTNDFRLAINVATAMAT